MKSFLTLLAAFALNPSAFSAKPNLLLILADDLGYGDVRCYNALSKVPTPNLDRLASEGMRFTDAHSPATVCTPSRYSLLTGQMAFRVPNGGTVFQGVGGKEWIEGMMAHLPGGQVGFLLFTQIFIFFIAFFLDFFEIAFIIVPLLVPVAEKLGIDIIWFGVLICANVQTSFMHPPFGFALFYLRGIAPREVRTRDIYWGAIPWLLLRVVGDDPGPGGGTFFSGTTFIQRINTAGGKAPVTGCKNAGDIGKKALVPYSTDYVFHR